MSWSEKWRSLTGEGPGDSAAKPGSAGPSEGQLVGGGRIDREGRAGVPGSKVQRFEPSKKSRQLANEASGDAETPPPIGEPVRPLAVSTNPALEVHRASHGQAEGVAKAEIHGQPDGGSVTAAVGPAHVQPPCSETPWRECVGHEALVSAVCLSADGRLVLSASDDHTLRLWEGSTAELVRTLEGHTSCVSAAGLSGDGTIAVSGGEDATLRLWDVTTGRCLKTVEAPGKVLSLALSADGGRAVLACSGLNDFVGGVDATLVQAWDMEGARHLRSLEGHTNATKSVAISADGCYALSGSDDKTLRLWDLESGSCRRIMEGHTHYVSCVALSADAATALSGSWDKTIRLWEVKSGRCLRVVDGHDGIVNAVAMSADGRIAISGGWDRTVRVWELDSGRCLHTFEGHSGMVSAVALSAEGGVGASGSWDKTVRLWDFSAPQ